MTVAATRDLTDATHLTLRSRVREISEPTRDAITAKRHLLHHTGVFPPVPMRELANASRTTQ